VFELQYSTSFCAAHRLCGYPGECANLHGHNWKVTVRVAVKELDSIGVAMDLKQLKMISEETITDYDHRYLNDLSPFQSENPTSENIARSIFYQMRDKLPSGVQMVSVSIGESDKYLVTYLEDPV